MLFIYLLTYCQCWFPRRRISALFSTFGGSQGLIVANSYRKINIHDNNNKNLHQQKFYMPVLK